MNNKKTRSLNRRQNNVKSGWNDDDNSKKLNPILRTTAHTEFKKNCFFILNKFITKNGTKYTQNINDKSRIMN